MKFLYFNLILAYRELSAHKNQDLLELPNCLDVPPFRITLRKSKNLKG